MIARFVKNSCAMGHLLAGREMKVQGIIIEARSKSASKIIFLVLPLSSPLSLRVILSSSVKMARDEKRQVKRTRASLPHDLRSEKEQP